MLTGQSRTKLDGQSYLKSDLTIDSLHDVSTRLFFKAAIRQKSKKSGLSIWLAHFLFVILQPIR